MTMQTKQTKFEVIHFLVQNVHLCFEIQYIVKVLPLVQLKPVPDSPSYLAGLMNIESKSIPVIDLALRLGLKRREKYTLATPIIICNDNSQETGIIVDEILGLSVAEKSALQMQTKFADPESLFRGVITLDTKLALLLNMQQILSIGLGPNEQPTPHDINSTNLTGFKYE
jgi:purine-binding chemotaxis protein CheW